VSSYPQQCPIEPYPDRPVSRNKEGAMVSTNFLSLLSFLFFSFLSLSESFIRLYLTPLFYYHIIIDLLTLLLVQGRMIIALLFFFLLVTKHQ
jgi:hypothetical protein